MHHLYPMGFDLPRATKIMPDVARILSRYDREKLEAFIAVAIDLTDLLDGDPDIEPNGDELDGSMGEDDFCIHSAGWQGHPGCPISDPGGGNVEDEAQVNDVQPYTGPIACASSRNIAEDRI